MKPRRRSVDHLTFPGASNRVIPQPLGVVGVIVPWNFPLQLSFSPLVSIFAAGNRAMVKMSENSQHLAELLSRDRAEIFCRRQARLLRRRRRPRAGVLVAAVRPPDLHRLRRNRPRGDGQRRAQPYPGDARTRRQVACGRGAGLPGQDGRGADPVGEDFQRRPGLSCGRPCVSAARRGDRVRRRVPAAVYEALSGRQWSGLHLDHRPAVL